MSIIDEPLNWGVIANIRGDKVLREGARVRVGWRTGEAEHIQVCGRSLGGRVVTKWAPIKRLSNFRARFYPFNRVHMGCVHPSKEAATLYAAELTKLVDDLRKEARRRAIAKIWRHWFLTFGASS